MLAVTFLALHLASAQPAEATPVASRAAPIGMPAEAAASQAEPLPVIQPTSASVPDPAAPPTTTEPSPSAASAPPTADPLSNPFTAPSTTQAAPTTTPAETAQTQADDLDLDLDRAANDPLEKFNRVSYKVSMVIDKIIIRPAAMVYRHAIPKPLRDGAHNALSNIGEPLVFLNDTLQLRPKRMSHTLIRFLLNSTLGLGGLFDVARRHPFKFPHHANTLGDTFGYYGVKPGPYIYVPVLGPTTLRDTLGDYEGIIPGKIVGGILNRSDYITTTSIVGGLDARERNDDDLKTMLSDAVDPYATFRANYLQDRAGEIAELKAKEVNPPKVGGGVPAATIQTFPASPADEPTPQDAAPKVAAPAAHEAHKSTPAPKDAEPVP